MRLLEISFGSGHFSYIDRVETLEWQQLATMLSIAKETPDKASVGWYVCAAFKDNYRDEEHMGPRECLTFDFDHIEKSDVGEIEAAFARLEYVIYTTHSHEPSKPRLRVVLPLSRPATPDEFRAVSRAVAAIAGINLVAPESHKPAQFMFMPAHRPNRKYRFHRHEGEWVDVDAILATYADWTDRKSWPCAQNDTTYKSDELPIPAREKPGVIGAFNRAYTISEAIEKFELPYVRVNETRWTYTAGSRPEGVRTYDDDTKLHSENATDPARGQHSAFDVVRLHRFGRLDAAMGPTVPIESRPSQTAMFEFCRSLPDVPVASVIDAFEDVPDEPAVEFAPVAVVVAGNDALRVETVVGGAGVDETAVAGDRSGRMEADANVESVATQPAIAVGGTAEPRRLGLARSLTDVLETHTKPRWLIKDELERGVIALLAGPRGSYKSFKALNWAMRVAVAGDAVYVVSAEGGDFDRRARAWVTKHEITQTLPLYVVERRLDLNKREGIDQIRKDCEDLKIRPVLFVLDTFSKLSGGLDENDNTQVKQFIGLLDNGLKRADTGFDATVLLVAHTGHSDKGRARGASALGADTDAEYIVRRQQNGKTIVLVSRERFKASPEQEPLVYEPEVVKLDYKDDEGRQVTSLILKPVDPSEVIGSGKKLSSEYEEALVVVQRELADGPKHYEDLIRAIKAEMPPPVSDDDKPARDTRLAIAKRRFHILEKYQYVRRNPKTNKVSQSTATQISAEAFDDEGGEA